MRRFAYTGIVSLIVLSMAACTNGSGGSDSGRFAVLSVSVQPGQGDVPLNQEIFVRFNQDVDETTLSSSTVAITPLEPLDSTRGATGLPFAGSVSMAGPREVRIQPACPTREDLSDAGLPAGYRVELTVGDSLRSVAGRRAESYRQEFSTSLADQRPLVDPTPNVELAALETSALPATLGLNALSNPNEPIEIKISKPVLASQLPDQPILARFEDPASPGVYYPVPAAVEILENCNASNGAVFAVTFLGILPPEPVEILLNKDLRDISGKPLGVDKPIAAFAVLPKPVAGDDNVPDGIVEDFVNDLQEDKLTALPAPRARWGVDGSLQPGLPFPGTFNSLDIEVGPGTANGVTKTIDSSFSTLIATDGSIVAIIDGVINCRNFTILRDRSGNGKHGKVEVVGPNPVQLNCSGSFLVEADARFLIEGQDAPGVVTVKTTNVPEPGGAGRGSGGSGGTASENTNKSTAKGGDGNGPFEALGAGGEGGHSAFGAAPRSLGSCTIVQAIPGGGGGGHFIENENWSDGDNDPFDSIEYISPEYADLQGFRYGRYGDGDDFEKNGGKNCDFLSGMSSGPDKPPCHGYRISTNTRGEMGGSGPRGTANDNFFIRGNGGSGVRKTIYDAVTGQEKPLGGVPSSPIFVNGDPEDDFFGTQVYNDPVEGLVMVRGELERLQGGAGGGAGGDSVNSPVFPPEVDYNFIGRDLKGAGGAGGGGALWVRAVGDIRVNGIISANGGDGGFGENVVCLTQAGGGSGGGAGGMIILESLTKVSLGVNTGTKPRLQANGGDRGYGVSRIDEEERCLNTDKCVGGASNFWVSCCVRKNSGGGLTGGLPAHSFRNSAYALGGAGGKGLIQVHVPHDAEGKIVEGSLGFQGIDIKNNKRVVDAVEGGFNQKRWLDPDPLVMNLSFGYTSAALSKWKLLGWRNEVDAAAADVAFDFSDTAKVIFSGSGDFSVAEGGESIRLANAAVLDAVAGNPRSLIHDVLRIEGRDRVITNSQIDDGDLVLYVDGADPVGNEGPAWEIVRTYVNVAGADDNFAWTVEFQGAEEKFPGSGTVDESSLTAFTANPADLNDFPFVRFRVTLNANALGLNPPPDPGQVVARILSLKGPFDF